LRSAFLSLRAAVQIAARAIARAARAAPAQFFETAQSIGRSLFEQVAERTSPREILSRAGGFGTPNDITLAAYEISIRSNRVLTADNFQQIETQYGANYRVVIEYTYREEESGVETTRHITLTSQRALTGREWSGYIEDVFRDIERQYRVSIQSWRVVGTFARA
jgi:hypothetical protein